MENIIIMIQEQHLCSTSIHMDIIIQINVLYFSANWKKKQTYTV